MMKPNLSFTPRAVAGICLLLLSLMFGACSSTPPRRTNAMAELVIRDKTRDQVVLAILEVMKENGFSLATSGSQLFVFEQQGTSWERFAYAGWYSEPVNRRMKLSVEGIGEGSQLVTCDAFRVIDPSDPRMAEEKRVTSKKGFCRKILEQVQARAEGKPLPSK